MRYFLYVTIFLILLALVTPFMFLESIDHAKDIAYLLANKSEYYGYMKNNALSFFLGFLGGSITLFFLNFKKGSYN